MSPQTNKRVYLRGLQFHEVAFVKRMQQRGHPRDYIFSFLARPGRKLSPACIDDVRKNNSTSHVEPASDEEVDAYIARRLAETRDDEAEYGPLSTYQIGEALGWLTRAQGDFLQDETQRVEFKSVLTAENDNFLNYGKTLAAFANNRGGYIFFGIDNDRIPIGIDEENFLSFDWDRLTSVCRERFQPEIRWNRTLTTWRGARLGVVYAFEAELKPVAAIRDGKGLERGTILFRYRGQNERIAIADLLNLLAERDDRVRAELMRSLVALPQNPP